MLKIASLDCSPDIILLFVFIKYAKMSYFVPLDCIVHIRIQVEKPRSNPHEKQGCSKWGCNKGGGDKGHVFISGMQKFCIL